MTVWPLLCLALWIDLPSVEVTTLKGERHQGALVELSDRALRLSRESETIDLSLAEVLEVHLASPPTTEPASGARVVLADGTQVTCREFAVRKNQATLDSLQCGAFAVPIARVAHVRLGISTAKLDEAWEGLLARESKKDLLVLRKEDSLDFLDGVAGDIGEKISFLIDGDEIPVARDRVYGLILRRKAGNLSKPICQMTLTGGDRLQASRVAWDGSQFLVRLAAGADLTLAEDAPLHLDFSAGKVKYLSQLEPRDAKYVSFWGDEPIIHEYRRDRSLDGAPLTLAGKVYPRGIALHSKSTLRYRLAGDYARFQAMLGIDDSVRRQGHVRVVISGDGKSLYAGDVKGTDPPRPLDLDVGGVRDLEILVDFGADLDIADHLDLADAKLIK
ncbi:MAG: NPCBM/NEW2 domain-containing protein [Planctomycetales bacterium]